jgi:glycosyl transferase, family 25
VDVYVINLDRQTERLRWMERGLAAVGVPFRRVPAVDAGRLSSAFIARMTEGNGRKLTRYEIALVMSHRKAWRALLRSPAPHALVFEDDVHIGHDFAALLAALDAGEAAFDIVKLESVGERVLVDVGSGRRVAGRLLCPLRSAYMGAAGYVINRRAAAKLLRVTRTMAVPADWFLFADSYLASNGLVVLQTVPGVVAQEEHLRKLTPNAEMRSGQPIRVDSPTLIDKAVREAARPLRQFAAAFARRRLMRVEPGLRWGRIGFE